MYNGYQLYQNVMQYGSYSCIQQIVDTAVTFLVSWFVIFFEVSTPWCRQIGLDIYYNGKLCAAKELQFKEWLS